VKFFPARIEEVRKKAGKFQARPNHRPAAVGGKLGGKDRAQGTPNRGTIRRGIGLRERRPIRALARVKGSRKM